MKKIVFSIIVCFVAIATVSAFEISKADTTVFYNKKRIELKDSVGQMKVKVFDAAGVNDSVPYKPVYEGIFSDGKTYEKWTVMEEIGLQIPFMKKTLSRHYGKMEPHWAGIGWGFANISDASLKINNIAGVPLKSGSSTEFFFNLIEKILPIYKNRVGITTGLGFNWRAYYLDDNTHLVETNGVTDVQPASAGVNYEYSKLKIAHITLPVLVEWQPALGNPHDKFFVSAGLVFGIKTYSVSKTKFRNQDGDMVKRDEAKGLNVLPLSLDYMAQVGYGDFNVYAKYSPFSIFESGKGPNVRAVSLGLMLNF